MRQTEGTKKCFRNVSRTWRPSSSIEHTQPRMERKIRNHERNRLTVPMMLSTSGRSATSRTEDRRWADASLIGEMAPGGGRLGGVGVMKRSELCEADAGLGRDTGFATGESGVGMSPEGLKRAVNKQLVEVGQILAETSHPCLL